MMGKLIDKENEVIEFVLDNKEIIRLVEQLQELRNSKSNLHFNINGKNHLLIHHKDDDLLK